MVCGLITRVNLVPLANRSDFTPCRVVMQAFRSMGYNKLELNNAMMKKINVLSSLLLILLLIAPVIANAQAATQTLSFSPESSITVDGTSNRDNWTVTAQSFEGQVTMNNNGDAPVAETVELTIPVQNMAGGKSSIMDRLMRNALKATQHPEITYVLNSMEVGSSSGDRVVYQTTGDLTLAGVTNTIEMEVEGTRLDNGSYQFTGSYPLNMNDYGIDAPTAMFGALVTGEDVTIHFDMIATE